MSTVVVVSFGQNLRLENIIGMFCILITLYISPRGGIAQIADIIKE